MCLQPTCEEKRTESRCATTAGGSCRATRMLDVSAAARSSARRRVYLGAVCVHAEGSKGRQHTVYKLRTS